MIRLILNLYELGIVFIFFYFICDKNVIESIYFEFNYWCVFRFGLEIEINVFFFYDCEDRIDKMKVGI